MRKTKVRLAKTVEERHMGVIPTENSVVSESELISVYNTFNYFNDRKDAIKFLTDWVNKNGHALKEVLNKIPQTRIPTTVGWVAKMKTDGVNLPSKTDLWFENKLAEIASFVENDEEEKPQEKKVHQYKEKEHLGCVDAAIDDFFETYTTEFSLKDEIQKKEYSTHNVRDIISLLERLIEEIKSFNKDQQVKEAYSFMTVKQRNVYVKFLEHMHAHAEAFISNKNRQRKPRKRKTISVEKKIAGVKLLEKSDEYNITSLPPEVILESSKIVLFNTANRMLTIYETANLEKFTIKGTTIQNWCPKKSKERTVRKPEEVLEALRTAGKRELNKIFNDLTTKLKACNNGRINNKTIILQAYK